MYFAGIFTCGCDIYGHRRLAFGKYPIYHVRQIILTPEILQTAQGVAANKDILAELFDRIGWFFSRLESYTNVSPTRAMTEIITQILVEVLKIFAIATKELKRGSTSGFPIGCVEESSLNSAQKSS